MKDVATDMRGLAIQHYIFDLQKRITLSEQLLKEMDRTIKLKDELIIALECGLAELRDDRTLVLPNMDFISASLE